MTEVEQLFGLSASITTFLPYFEFSDSERTEKSCNQHQDLDHILIVSVFECHGCQVV